MKFVKILKSKISKDESREECAELISNQDIQEAKQLWHREVQKSMFSDKKMEETKKNLHVFEDDDGILRVGGRIDNAPLPYETKFPILLPRRHHFTYLIVYKSHTTVKHNGVRETLTEIRSEYWITKGRQIVKTLLSKCVICKKLIGKAYDSPDSPPLPPFRVSEDMAFSQIAVDFAGPLYVKDIYTKSTTMNKCYIALFTCTSTRAVHLELVPDLHANSFIRALNRFIGRRGVPSHIVSDNGKTFVDQHIQNYIRSRGANLVWRFNVPTASWWGGVFEVMVKLTKRCLRKTLGHAHLTYEELETNLIETEGILNSRPLTFVHEDICEPPLTPSCLVTGRRLLNKGTISQNVEKSDRPNLTKRSRYLDTLLDRFFSQWKKEYLPSLREKFQPRNKPLIRVPRVGDIVNIHKDKVPRQRWTIGKITRLLPGKDGIVRAVEVLTLDKSRKQMIMKRPIQHLYPLEVQAERTKLEHTEHDKLENELANEVQITTVRDEDVPEQIQ